MELDLSRTNGRELKRALLERFGIKLASARRGERGWWTLRMAEGWTLHDKARADAEQWMVERGICGRYYTDHGVYDDWAASISWQRSDGVAG